jgi:hypothetical protein
MPQLFCRDLKCGDIMLQVSSGAFTSKLVALGQRLAGGLNPLVVHAGIMFDSTYLIESLAQGVTANDLRVGNAKCGYMVFRPSAGNANLANGAGTFAKVVFDVHKTRGSAGYSWIGAAMSILGRGGRAATASAMDAVLDRILAGRTHRFFCSQLVVMVYQFVGEQNGIPGSRLFPFADAKVSPSLLAQHLHGSTIFDEVGYMMPNER